MGKRKTKQDDPIDITEWMLSVGKDRALRIMQDSDDEDYMRYYLQLLEYHAPKLARVESTNKNDTTINIQVNWDDTTVIHTTTATALQSGESS